MEIESKQVIRQTGKNRQKRNIKHKKIKNQFGDFHILNRSYGHNSTVTEVCRRTFQPAPPCTPTGPRFSADPGLSWRAQTERQTQDGRVPLRLTRTDDARITIGPADVRTNAFSTTRRENPARNQRQAIAKTILHNPEQVFKCCSDMCPAFFCHQKAPSVKQRAACGSSLKRR